MLSYCVSQGIGHRLCTQSACSVGFYDREKLERISSVVSSSEAKPKTDLFEGADCQQNIAASVLLYVDDDFLDPGCLAALYEFAYCVSKCLDRVIKYFKTRYTEDTRRRIIEKVSGEDPPVTR